MFAGLVMQPSASNHPRFGTVYMLFNSAGPAACFSDLASLPAQFLSSSIIVCRLVILVNAN